MESNPFLLEDFFPRRLYERITDIRISNPDVMRKRAQDRLRPDGWVKANGRIVILAADHPARAVTSAAGDPLAMGSRYGYLGRLVRVLSTPHCDGILGTPDILEDLMILDSLMVEAGLDSMLDGRIMVGTMNRGGLAGASFEMDDTFTAYTVDQIADSGLDAAKAMFRLDETNPDSVKTITDCARAIDACVDRNIPMYLEALPVACTDAGYRVVKTPEALIRTVGVASGLGKSSMNTWIKIPYSENYADVAGSTTCPVLMLGGESTGDPTRVFEEFAAGMAASPNVRGALVGRNVHHPGTNDPAAVAAAVYGVVHDDLSPADAAETVSTRHREQMDRLSRAIHT
jgi:DhnA family fructose-bisphosphate aldolase class Ia